MKKIGKILKKNKVSLNPLTMDYKSYVNYINILQNQVLKTPEKFNYNFKDKDLL